MALFTTQYCVLRELTLSLLIFFKHFNQQSLFPPNLTVYSFTINGPLSLTEFSLWVWGCVKNTFPKNHPGYQTWQTLSRVISGLPALCYKRIQMWFNFKCCVDDIPIFIKWGFGFCELPQPRAYDGFTPEGVCPGLNWKGQEGSTHWILVHVVGSEVSWWVIHHVRLKVVMGKITC